MGFGNPALCESSETGATLREAPTFCSVPRRWRVSHTPKLLLRVARFVVVILLPVCMLG